jgi:hypothetical protein
MTLCSRIFARRAKICACAVPTHCQFCSVSSIASTVSVKYNGTNCTSTKHHPKHHHLQHFDRHPLDKRATINRHNPPLPRTSIHRSKTIQSLLTCYLTEMASPTQPPLVLFAVGSKIDEEDFINTCTVNDADMVSLVSLFEKLDRARLGSIGLDSMDSLGWCHYLGALWMLLQQQMPLEE